MSNKWISVEGRTNLDLIEFVCQINFRYLISLSEEKREEYLAAVELEKRLTPTEPNKVSDEDIGTVAERFNKTDNGADHLIYNDGFFTGFKEGLKRINHQHLNNKL